jgi:hypothetical protein
MKKSSFTLFLLLLVGTAFAQGKYMTRNGAVSFTAEGVVKDGVQAKNDQGACVLDASTGDVVFQILIKSFQFQKALMQEHFNENYMESHKYPKAVLKGKINDWASIDLKKNGTHLVTVTGDLNIHGVSQKVTKSGKVEVKDGKIRLTSDFDVTLADHNIAIPKIVEEKIAKTAQISLNMMLDPTK